MSPKRLFFLSGEEEEKIRGVAVCCMGKRRRRRRKSWERKEGRKGTMGKEKGSHIPRVRFDNFFRMLCDRNSHLELTHSKISCLKKIDILASVAESLGGAPPFLEERRRRLHPASALPSSFSTSCLLELL